MFLQSIRNKTVNKKDWPLPSRGSWSSRGRQRDKEAITMMGKYSVSQKHREGHLTKIGSRRGKEEISGLISKD